MNPSPANYQQMLATFQGGAPGQQQATPAAPGGGQMGAKSVFHLAGGQTVDDTYAAQLAQQFLGMPVGGVTPDGSAFMLQNGQTVPIAQVLGQLGAQVTSFRPLNADYSQAQPMLRAALATLPDDFRRKQYLEQHMQGLGLQQPLVEGSGDDWFIFNPEQGNWVAATNAPGMDMTDAAGGLISGTKMAGAIGGGIIGAGAGPLGLIGGSAAGGAGVNALQKAAFEMFDPTYGQIRAQMGEGEVLADIGKGAAVDAAGAALGYGGGRALGAMMGRGAHVPVAPMSRMAQTTGGGAEAVGRVMNRGANLFDKQWIGRPGSSVTQGIHGHDIAAGAMPVSGPLQMAGVVAELPAMGVRGANTAAQWAGRGVPGQPGARQILSELGGAAGRGIGRRMPAPAVGDDALAPFLKDAQIYNSSGLVELGGPERLAQELWRDEMAAQIGARGRSIGSGVGDFLEGLEKLGVGAEEVSRKIGAGAVKGTKYLGQGLETGGGLARQAGAIGRKVEDQLYGQLGAEEAYSRMPRASLDPYERYRAKVRQTYLAGGN